MDLSYVIILRLVLAPVLVAAATSAGYRFGPKVTGWIVGFPVVAGPILLLFTIEQGPEFAAKAAESSVLGIVSLVAFCVAYLVVARSYSWPVSVLCGWICFSCCTFFAPEGAHSVVGQHPGGILCSRKCAALTPKAPDSTTAAHLHAVGHSDPNGHDGCLGCRAHRSSRGPRISVEWALDTVPYRHLGHCGVCAAQSRLRRRVSHASGATRVDAGLYRFLPMAALGLVPLGVWAAFICALSANLMLLLLALARMRTQRR